MQVARQKVNIQQRGSGLCFIMSPWLGSTWLLGGECARPNGE